MFHYLSKVMRYNKAKNKNASSQKGAAKKDTLVLSAELNKNLEALKSILGESDDIIIRKFSLGCKTQTNGAVVFIGGIVDINIIDSHILKPLMFDISEGFFKEELYAGSMDNIYKKLLPVGSIRKEEDLNNLTVDILSGGIALFVDGCREALAIDAAKWKSRAIDKPETESVVRGSREGFTENLRTSIAQLRRKIKNPDLRFESYTIGERTRTDVCIAYIKGIVNPKLIPEIKKRLDTIKIDAVLESGYIEAFIEDAPYSIFATVGNSEKPDTVAAKMLEGRAAILVDGTPFVLTVPLLFIESFQSSEDYYSRPFYSSILRSLRFLAYLISILAPATYVALSSFHQELIPTLLLFTMVAGHEGVPFPSFLEAAIMIITFEILREAGVRLPKPVGSAVSIVGALVIGESAVSAGLIGPLMVIIVALTAISSFVIPAQTDSASILRYFLLVLAGLMGGFGIIMGLLLVFIHLASLRSFGVPYLTPLAPFVSGDMKDVFIRTPLRKMISRPKLIGRRNSRRQQSDSQAEPNEGQNS